MRRMVHARSMTVDAGSALAKLEHEVRDTGGLDGFDQVAVPLAPIISLHLAQDAIVWWARMEASAGRRLDAPFWASAWAGGQAVARYVLDNPDTVAGRRVLDIAAGSGMVGIAAGLAGASRVVANDIDAYAIAAVTMNARLNGVRIETSHEDLLDGSPLLDEIDVVLAGDVFYGADLADRFLGFLRRASAAGKTVLVGDPERGYLPEGVMRVLATYEMPVAFAFGDAELDRVNVLAF
jgi:predicted nicotinamide N-methyase